MPASMTIELERDHLRVWPAVVRHPGCASADDLRSGPVPRSTSPQIDQIAFRERIPKQGAWSGRFSSPRSAKVRAQHDRQAFVVHPKVGMPRDQVPGLLGVADPIGLLLESRRAPKSSRLR